MSAKQPPAWADMFPAHELMVAEQPAEGNSDSPLPSALDLAPPEDSVIAVVDSIADDTKEAFQYFDGAIGTQSDQPELQKFIDQVNTRGRSFSRLMVRLTAIAEQGKAMAEETKILYRKLTDRVSAENKTDTIQTLVRMAEDGIDRSQEAQTTCGIMAMDFMEQKITLAAKENRKRFIPFRLGSSASAGMNLTDDMSRRVEIVAKTLTILRNWWAYEVDVLKELSIEQKTLAVLDRPGIENLISQWSRVAQRYTCFHTKLSIQTASKRMLFSSSGSSSVPPDIPSPSPIDDSDQSLIPFPRTITSMTLGDLSQRISSLQSKGSQTKVNQIILRKETRGVKHEYLLVESTAPSGRGYWMRLERGAAERDQILGNLNIWRSRSEFKPDDTARLANTEDELIVGELSVVRTTVRFIPSDSVSLSTLEILLSAFVEESRNYSLLTENCFFFCAVVIGVLSNAFAHKLDGKLQNAGLGAATQERIRKLFHERITASHDAG